MSTVLITLAVLFPAAALTALMVFSFRKHLRGVSGKRILKTNLLAFALVLVITATLAFSASAVEGDAPSAPPTPPEQAAQAEQAAGSNGDKGLGLLAAGLVTGLAGIGGGIAVAAGAPAAIAATSEDPKSFGKSLIFVALGESIALYGVVISILILNKL